MKSPIARTLLIVITAFAAISAVGGGIGLIAANGMGIPMAYL